MSDFFKVSVDDAVEMGTLPAGTEAKLRIVDAEPNEEKCYIRLRLEVVSAGGLENEFLKDITEFLHFPRPDDESKKINNKKLRLKSFYKAFGIPESGPSSLDEFKGREGWVIVGEDTNERYGTQNTIQGFATTN